MIFALIDGEVADARQFDNDAIVVGTCWRCGKQVELRHARPGEARSWMHSDRDDAAMCNGDKDAIIKILREKIWDLEETIRILGFEIEALRDGN